MEKMALLISGMIFIGLRPASLTRKDAKLQRKIKGNFDVSYPQFRNGRNFILISS
jgi:hypothetical protein